ncbi:MAG TPA: tetratricopeptide repeat protein [Vicinamibacterales bacterium]|nr:tetratricopeptide repeat protein [Vicinamibacterales bacterium]
MSRIFDWLKFRLGVQLAKAGRHQQALGLFRAVLRRTPHDIYQHQWEAACLDRLGRQDEAIAAFQDLIARAPEDGWAYRRLGSILHSLGRYEEAVPLYAAAAERPRADGAVSYDLGMCHEALEHWQDAAMAFRRAANLRQDHADTFAKLSDMFGRLGHWEDAETAIRRAVTLNPRSLAWRVRLARVLVNLERNDDALALLQDARDDNPRETWGIAERVNLLRTLGQPHAAEEAARQAVTRLSRRIKQDPQDAAAAGNLGFVFGELEQWEDAVRYHRRALELDPTADQAENLGIALEILRRPDDAVSAFREALRMNRSSPDIKDRLGIALLQAGRTREAMEVLRPAASEHPNHGSLLATFSMALGGAGSIEEAFRMASRAVEVEPDSGHARAAFGLALLSKYRPVEALDQFEHARRIDPTGTNEAFYLTGCAQALQGLDRLGEAERAAREALALDAASIDVKVVLGGVLSEMNRHDEALTMYRGLCEERPKDAQAFAGLSFALQYASRLEEGALAAEHAVDLDPKMPYSQTALGWARLREARPVEALERFDRAHELEPENAGGMACRGAALSALGRHAEAVGAFDAVSAAAPDFFKYYGEDFNEYVERSRSALGLGPWPLGLRPGP